MSIDHAIYVSVKNAESIFAEKKNVVIVQVKVILSSCVMILLKINNLGGSSMGEWKKVSRCKTCGKVYSDGIPEICRKCGTVIATRNNVAAIFTDRYMFTTENTENIVARKHLFKWEFKPEN